MRKDWTLIRHIKGGHRYWRHANGEIGISDDSGTYPENCEPGDRPPLLLDRARPVELGEHNAVPIKRVNGETSATPASAFEALWVATHFDLEVHAYEKGGKVPMRVTVQDAP